jgi:catechol 2,3-dioxygenase-like lactoylglutathione lyase family enzyme
MRVDSITPILNVSDLRASLEWFEAFGWKTGFVWGEPPGFASIVCGSSEGRGEIFLCLNGQGSRGTRQPEREFDERADGVWMSWFLPSREELDAAYARARELGYEISLEPRDEPWGMREFHLRHPDGHIFRVSAESG